MAALSKLTQVVDGELRIVDESPLIVPIDRLADGVERDRILKDLRGVLAVYRDSLPAERRRLFDPFELADLARKVVGVGSVGNEAWIALLLGTVGASRSSCRSRRPSRRCSKTSPAPASSQATASASSSASD